MADTPQIRCLDCGASMPYMAAACPNCKRRMVKVEIPKPTPSLTAEERAAQWSPEWAAGKTPSNRGAIGAIIAIVIVVGMMFLCMSSGKELPEERRTRERYEEMRPLREEMERKQREGKTQEEAAREIVDEEVKRQEQKKQQGQQR
jgi:hypothetical protein